METIPFTTGFVLIEDEATDFLQDVKIKGIYGNIEDAKKAMREWVDAFKASGGEYDEVEEDSDTEYCTFRYGRYPEYHYSLYIQEAKVF